MASLREDRINFEKLEKNALSAIESDKLYWLRNDAKFRAVKQKGTYEEFKEIVAAAHLKPLYKNDKIQYDERIVAPWNPNAKKNHETGTYDGPEALNSQNLPDFQPPKNSQDFIRMWRSLATPKEKVNYLIFNTEHQVFEQIFSTELTSGLLGQFMAALREYDAADISPIIIEKLLIDLSQTGRFSMGLIFLSEAEKNDIQFVLGRFSTPNSLQRLRQLYQV